MTFATPAVEAVDIKPHGFVTRAIHWLSVLLIGYGYLKGLDDVNQLADPALLRFEVLFAAALGLLFMVRLLWTRKIGGATRLPAEAPWWERHAARLVHRGLYGVVFAVVGTGMGIAYAYASPLFGDAVIDLLIGMHEMALTSLPLLIAAHIVGALWHKFFRRDGVMESMTGKLPV